jgi:uncharacterized membrane protein (UPF0127 family)
LSVKSTRDVMRRLLGAAAVLVLAGGGTTLWASTPEDGPLPHRAYAPGLAADSAPPAASTPSQPTTTPGASSTAPAPSATPTPTVSATSTVAPGATVTSTAAVPQYLAVTVSQGEQSATVTAELALTPAQWQHGLMGRISLADDQGMLFVFPSERSGGFWMAGTPIPLDIAYINAAGAVFDIKHGEPYDPTPLVPSGPYRYVLEVRGGWFEDMGMGVGAQVEGLEGLP